MLSSYYGLFALFIYPKFLIFSLLKISCFPKLSLAAVFIIVLMFSHSVSISSCSGIFSVCCVTICVKSHQMLSKYSNLIL
jgi:hypothetical protein